MQGIPLKDRLLPACYLHALLAKLHASSLSSHLSAEEAMTLEFQGTIVLGRQSMNLQSSRIDAKKNPVAAPTRRAQTSGTEPPPRRLATYSYSSFAPSSLRITGQHYDIITRDSLRPLQAAL